MQAEGPTTTASITSEAAQQLDGTAGRAITLRLHSQQRLDAKAFSLACTDTVFVKRCGFGLENEEDKSYSEDSAGLRRIPSDLVIQPLTDPCFQSLLSNFSALWTTGVF